MAALVMGEPVKMSETAKPQASVERRSFRKALRAGSLRGAEREDRAR